MEAAGRWLMSALLASLVSPSHHKDPISCPSANFPLPEGASEVIVADISTYSKTLLLYKRNDSSSDWHEILLITEGQINPVDTAYADHFYISRNCLAIQKASKALTGCYKLAYDLQGSCVQHFCLRIQGSKLTNLIIIGICILVVVVVVLVSCVEICIWKKKKQRVCD